MEKKKAMKILKDFHDKSALFSVRTALDTIIPELKESEDEKIIKWLIEGLRRELYDFLNTLEVKEVDLDFQRFAKEMDAIFALPSSETKNTEENPLNWEYAIAKHFFELGMAVNIKAQKGEGV